MGTIGKYTFRKIDIYANWWNYNVNIMKSPLRLRDEMLVTLQNIPQI